ncbi:hypothetical protein F5148DRAFT_1216339 [Russula earlei]|uniref:Uncharacterized protein n=1 Tax=Russula earlei TaxID=71964 RepID=A0ACC0U385_9AGAM|nr:hypothetical protein F5148DRAFT_1216339 [Russula earlei]
MSFRWFMMSKTSSVAPIGRALSTMLVTVEDVLLLYMTFSGSLVGDVSPLHNFRALPATPSVPRFKDGTCSARVHRPGDRQP